MVETIISCCSSLNILSFLELEKNHDHTELLEEPIATLFFLSTHQKEKLFCSWKTLIGLLVTALQEQTKNVSFRSQKFHNNILEACVKLPVQSHYFSSNADNFLES